MTDKTDSPGHFDTANDTLLAMIHGMTTEEAGDALSAAFFLAFMMMGARGGVSDEDRIFAIMKVAEHVAVPVVEVRCNNPDCPDCATRDKTGSLH